MRTQLFPLTSKILGVVEGQIRLSKLFEFQYKGVVLGGKLDFLNCLSSFSRFLVNNCLSS